MIVQHEDDWGRVSLVATFGQLDYTETGGPVSRNHRKLFEPEKPFVRYEPLILQRFGTFEKRTPGVGGAQ